MRIGPPARPAMTKRFAASDCSEMPTEQASRRQQEDKSASKRLKTSRLQQDSDGVQQARAQKRMARSDRTSRVPFQQHVTCSVSPARHVFRFTRPPPSRSQQPRPTSQGPCPRRLTMT
eukprot:2197230-Rhodomonas_salina.4